MLDHRLAVKLPVVVSSGKPCFVVESDEESNVEEEESREGASLADAFTTSVMVVSILLFSLFSV